MNCTLYKKSSNEEKIKQCKERYEGKIFYTRFGTEFKVIKYIDISHIEIEFTFSGRRFVTAGHSINTGHVLDPFINYKSKNNTSYPFIYEGSDKNKLKEYLYINKIFKNKFNEHFKIIKYINYDNVFVQCLEYPNYTTIISVSNLKFGHIVSPYLKNSYGGYVGPDKTYRGTKFENIHKIWYAILMRTSKKNLNNPKYKNYYDCEVSEEWLCYGNFARDYMNKYSVLNPNFKYNLDKDLLYPYYKNRTNGKKLYSNDTTVLLPVDINSKLASFKKSKLIINCYHDFKIRYNTICNFNKKVQYYYDNNGLSKISYDALVQFGGECILNIQNKFKEYKERYDKEIN